MPSMIQRRCNSPQGVTVLAQVADLIQHCLLAGVWIDVLSVSNQPIAETQS